MRKSDNDNRSHAHPLPEGGQWPSSASPVCLRLKYVPIWSTVSIPATPANCGAIISACSTPSSRGNNANTWSFGGEYLQTYKPYGEKGHIPVAQFTGEVGYNLHTISDYSQTFHLYGGLSALAGYETVNWGKRLLPDGSTIQAKDAFIYGGAVTLCLPISSL